MADTLGQSPHDEVGIHLHPKEMTGIDVGRNGRGERCQPLKGFDIVGNGAGMELQTNHQRRIGSYGEVADLRPVVLDLMLPLALIDAFQIGKPPAAGEMRRHIAREPGRAAGERDDSVDPKFAGEPDGVAERDVMVAAVHLMRRSSELLE